MREIKFRAWDKEDKEMRSFESLCDGDFDSWPSLYYALTDDRYYIPMQYTGLKDKNGKEIYEGDIVKVYIQERVGSADDDLRKIEIGFVDFRMGSFELIADDDLGNKGLNRALSSVLPSSEVIGNVYEHPDLLK